MRNTRFIVTSAPLALFRTFLNGLGTSAQLSTTNVLTPGKYNVTLPAKSNVE